MNINTSLCKAFFKSVDARSTPEAIQKFRELLEVAGTEIAQRAADNARLRKRKTVSIEDLQ